MEGHRHTVQERHQRIQALRHGGVEVDGRHGLLADFCYRSPDGLRV